MFIRTTGNSPLPEELRICPPCEQANDAIRGLKEAAAGQFASDDELNAALDASSAPVRDNDAKPSAP
jgi:hypothetical protein